MSHQPGCCEHMAAQLAYVCPDHPERWECPDILVAHDPFTGSYGLWIHDGGSSSIGISYCPWCGATLGEDADA